MNQLDTAIHTKLAATSGVTSLLNAGTAGVFQHVATQGANAPYVVFGKTARTPTRVMGGGAVGTDAALYMVKAITEGQSAAAAGSIAAAIDTALDRSALTVSGHTTLSVYRDSDIDYAEPLPGGSVAYHRGALYRVVIDPT